MRQPADKGTFAYQRIYIKEFLTHAEYEALRMLMENRGIRQRDLISVFGSSSVVSDALSGKRSISKTHARKLAEFFDVPASLFI
ncbi:MAG: helix-turn-helix domain-containing protein [Bryobacteraceae bacterium]